MKKILVMAAAAMMAVMSVNAQEDQKNELSISYGTGISLIGDGIGNGFANGLFDSAVGHEMTNDKNFGTLALEYFRHLDNHRWAIGGILTFARFSEDVQRKDNKVKIGDRARNYFTVMPSVKYYWVNKTHFGFYSKAAVGVMFASYKSNNDVNHTSDSDTDINFTGQVSPVGFEGGALQYRGFLEAGFGEQGIVLAGFRYRF